MKRIRVFLVLLLVVSSTQESNTEEEPPCNLVDPADEEAKTYLEQFGYIPHPFQQPGQPDTRNITEGILKFQRFNGLNETGVLDDATKAQFDVPRCGLPDTPDEGPEEFVTSTNKWTSTSNLRYYIEKYTTDLSRDTIRQIVRDAWQVWADVTSLTFTEVGPGERADFILQFEANDHRDGYPFDGRGGVLAHAFYPTNGKCHFDDDEPWTHRTSAGINLFSVAVHEFGHSLGLKHSSVSGAVMAPYYQGYQGDNYRLGNDDIRGIQSLYGANTGTSGGGSGGSGGGGDSGGSGGGGSGGGGNPPPTTPSTTPSNACSGEFNSLVKTQDGTLYGFSGSYVWDLTGPLIGDPARESLISSTFGRSTSGTDWTSPSAAVTVSGKTYIFKGCEALQFTNTNYEQTINIRSKWLGLPCNIGAAFTAKDGYTYFFLGAYVYKFRGNNFVEFSFISYIGWNGLPSALRNGFDAISASGNTNDDVFIFKGDEYWKLRQSTKTFYSGYPRDIKPIWLKSCSQ